MRLLSHFLGETTNERVARFRELNRAARSYATQPATRGAAESYYQAARDVLAQIPGNAVYQDELAYTRQILDGDSAARSDYSAGQDLLARAKVNAVPDDASAAWGQGFREGLGKGVKDLTDGKWFFGRDPSELMKKVTAELKWTSPVVWIALAGGGWLVLRNVNGITKTIGAIFRRRR